LARTATLEFGSRPDALLAVELKARALLALGRPAEALVEVDGALPLADELRLASMRWRLRAARARALDALDRSAEAAAERAAVSALLAELAATIDDDDLRRTFVASAEGA